MRRSRFRRLRTLAADEDGASLMEYGLLVLLITLAALAAVATFGTQVTALFTETDRKLPNS